MTDNPFDVSYVEREPEPETDVFGLAPIRETVEKPQEKKAVGPVFHTDLVQGSDDWLAERCGVLTASEMCRIITPTLKTAANDKSRAHEWELLFQRITGFVEPQYVSDAMLRGQEDEIYARAAYAEHYAAVTEVGFITNDKWGFTLGYSPDGLVGNDGLIECKSRAGRFQIQTIAENEVPEDYMIQLQTGMLVAERNWCDFISYSAGLPVFVKRVEADPLIQGAILAAAQNFELKLQSKLSAYQIHLAAMKLIPTERREAMEIIL